MKCNICGDKVIYCKGMCRLCYNRMRNNLPKKTERFYFRIGKPLTEKQKEHNLLLMYKKHKLWKKKNE